MLSPEGRSYILAGAIISIALNPLVFSLVNPLYKWLSSFTKLEQLFATENDPLSELPLSTKPEFFGRTVVLVGYGRVGRRIALLLNAKRSLCRCG